MCLGSPEIVKVNATFRCLQGEKMTEFKKFMTNLRHELLHGSARHSERCSHLSREEYINVVQAFNLGIRVGWYRVMKSAAAVMGGPWFFVNCDLWKNQMGNEWFGSLVTHEMGHAAGYGHPVFETAKFESECKSISSTFCEGHCKQWTSACVNHAMFGSSICNGVGCSTTCVKKSSKEFGHNVHRSPSSSKYFATYCFEGYSFWMASCTTSKLTFLSSRSSRCTSALHFSFKTTAIL